MVTVPEETEPAIPPPNTNTSKPTKMKARRSAPPSVCPSFRRDQLLVTNRAILERETPGQQQQHQQPSARKAKSLSPRPQRRRHGAGEGGGLIYNNQANRKHRSPLPELPTTPFVSSVPISSKRVTILSIRMSSKHEATTNNTTKTKNIGNDHNTTTKQHEFARVHYVGTKRRESTKNSSSKLASKSIESRAELNNNSGAEAGRAEEMMAQIQAPPIIAAASTTADHDDTAAAASATTTKTEEAQPQREKPVLSFAWDDVSSHKADDQRRNDTNTVIPPEPKIVITDPSQTNNTSKEFIGCMILLQEQTKKLQQYKNTTKQQHNKMTLYASNPIVLRKNSSSSIPHRKKIQYTNDISLWLQPWASIHYYTHTRKYDLVIGGIENYVIMKMGDKKSSSRFSKLFGGTKQQQQQPQIAAYHILWKPT
eukprot:CAMPEP_0119549178 /NCGR_PEP_ID=MMETSP1352-20130426/2943_1 /TAXON_ID=265584 /ORGANISM="Stauroneis constricta, Strain CCMP1120" /LENGTH=424 /DNA_ID=CAMNT_0007594669 /DNA_START=145 /DNA_END=1415 /DNA_ORIENTATION=+